MRRILVDHARASHARKRGNGWDAVSLNEAILPSPERAPEILALDEALNKLAAFDERQSKIVELRFFAGMNEDEAGSVLGISARTVKRDWQIAKGWLLPTSEASTWRFLSPRRSRNPRPSSRQQIGPAKKWTRTAGDFNKSASAAHFVVEVARSPTEGSTVQRRNRFLDSILSGELLSPAFTATGASG